MKDRFSHGTLSVLFSTALIGGCTTSMVTSKPVGYITPDDARGSLVYALPKTLVKITIADYTKADTKDPNLTVTSFIAADPEQVYVLDYTPNPFSKDDLTVGIASRDKPILANLNAEAEDQTLQALKEAAWSSTRFRWLALKSGGTGNQREVTFDPHDPSELAAARSSMGAWGLDVQCQPGCPPRTPPATAPAKGLMMRAAIPVQLAICKGSCETSLPERIESIPSYNASPIYHFPVRRSGFVTRTTQLVYVGGPDLGTGAGTQTTRRAKNPTTEIPQLTENPNPGALKTVVINKPSEALQIAQVPGVVIGALVSGLTDKLIDGSTAAPTGNMVLEQEVAMLKAEVDLAKAKLNLPTPQGGQ